MARGAGTLTEPTAVNPGSVMVRAAGTAGATVVPGRPETARVGAVTVMMGPVAANAARSMVRDAGALTPPLALNALNAISHQIIGAAIEVHKVLGPGLLESAYEACLAHELVLGGLAVDRQVALPVEYRGLRVDAGYLIDLLVQKAVIVELKAADAIHPIHEA